MRLNIQRLSAEGVANEYRQKLDERIEEQGSTDNLNEIWKSIHNSIDTVAREVIGTTQGRQHKEWFDVDCQRATDEKDLAWKRMLTAATRQNRERYNELRAAEKRIHRRKKREYEERILNAAQESFERNDVRRFYATVNSVRNKSFPSPVMCNDREGNLLTEKESVLARWKEHFEMLLNGQSNRVDIESRMRIGEDGQTVEPPTLAEVQKAIKELKNCKAAGKDGLPAELLKSGSEQLHNTIHQVIQRIWVDEQMPSDWLESHLPIVQEGS